MSDQPVLFLSAVRPTLGHRRLAQVCCVGMGLVFAATMLLVGIKMPVITGFVPTIDGLLCVCNFVTALILIGQFLQLRNWSMLVLTACFISNFALIGVHFVAYSNILLDDKQVTFNHQIGPWTNTLTHVLMPLFVMLYSLVQGAARLARPQRALAWMFAIVAGCVLGVSGYLFSATDLPILFAPGGIYTWITAWILVPSVCGFDLAVIGLLWWRGNSILDLWLKVVLCSNILNALTVYLVVFHVYAGFYASRLFAVLGAVFVLGALLHEMSRLYARLFAMNQRQKLDSDAQYRAIVDTAIDAILVIDDQGMVTAANPAVIDLFGYPLAAVTAHSIEPLLAQPWHAIRHETTRLSAVQGRHQDGSALALEVSIAEWHRDTKLMVTAMFRDVGERKRIEGQLIQAQKMEAIGQLTGGMAHDFNNVLGIIIGNLDMLVEQLPVPVPAELTDALAASMAGADLVKHLLAFARRQPLQARMMRLETVVEEMLPLIKRSIGGRIAVAVHYDSGLAPVIADSGQFANALLNLAVNARDAMPTGGTLRIDCQACHIDTDSSVEYDIPIGDYSTLIVSDTGSGMSPALLARVIEPFFTTKPVGKGSGLGLSMVFGYAKQSGGVLRLYSEVGRGTSVRLYLPIAPASDATVASSVIEPADITALHGTQRILVVEDTAQARTVAQRILLSLGYRVFVVADAAEAIALLATDDQFDLIFSDIVMPGALDGLDLARHVKQVHPAIKLLLTSGFAALPETVVAELAVFFLTKPYRKLDLAKMLRQIFEPPSLGSPPGL